MTTDELRAGVDALRDMLEDARAEIEALTGERDSLARRLEQATGRPVFRRARVEADPPGCIPMAALIQAQLDMLREGE